MVVRTNQGRWKAAREAQKGRRGSKSLIPGSGDKSLCFCARLFLSNLREDDQVGTVLTEAQAEAQQISTSRTRESSRRGPVRGVLDCLGNGAMPWVGEPVSKPFAAARKDSPGETGLFCSNLGGGFFRGNDLSP
eukprot:scaffold47_cov258-Pinguiococcus_pyrenoidosus.AAC.55